MKSVREIYIKLTFALTMLALMAIFGCKKAYNPQIVSIGLSQYLVVEGNISTGTDSTVIRLSRTVPLNSKVGTKAETGAIMTIIGDDNSTYPVMETSNGFYKARGLNSVSSVKYSLKIITSDSKVYLSDLVQAKKSPPIDSVYYRVKNNGVQIYADTHDPANGTKYYRWDFSDTYLYHSQFGSYDYAAKVPADTVLPRPLNMQIYTCWRSDTAQNILLNSTARLTQDVISENPINFIPSTSEKIASRYSILVRQYALTPEAFEYFQQLKKNTEQLGSIFDAQPSELPGNIHCQTNPTEQVLGYITAGSSTSARIFIDNRNLPAWRADNPYEGCFIDTDYYAKPLRAGGFEYQVQEFIYTGLHIPLYPIAPPGGPIIGFAAAVPQCVDCTLRGTNKQPSYWKQSGQ